MADETQAGAAYAASGATNPWLVALVVAFAAFMEVLDTTIVNVALPHVAGGLGVSVDEASWVVTTYLIANAAALVASPFFGRWLGRKTFFITCLALFTAASVACGFAWNIETLLLSRILQGLGGGGMVPVSQSILAETFPPENRGQGFAMFGVAVVVAPVIGPILGGWLTENWSWHWCFLINGPVGLIAIALIASTLRQSAAAVAEARRRLRQEGGFDLVGFLLVATFLGSLEIMLDRGLIDDWFDSSFIVTVAIICCLAFALMVPWELSRRSPMIDLRMVGTRQFGSCFIIMLAAGGTLLATTQFLPLLVQNEFGYTAVWAGLILTPGGLVAMGMMFVVGYLSGRIQPKYLIAIGTLIVAFSMHILTAVYGDLDFWFFAISRMVLSVGLPLVFLPIITASYEGIAPDKTDQASALINSARNTGGSIGISLTANIVAHREQFHHSRLVENVVPSNISFQDTVQQVMSYFIGRGSSPQEAQGQVIAWIGDQVQTQATFLAYVDAFWVLMLMSLAVIPLALMLRNTPLGTRRGAGSHPA